MSLPQSKTDAQGHLRTLLCRSLSHLQLLRIPEGMNMGWGGGGGGGGERGEGKRGEGKRRGKRNGERRREGEVKRKEGRR